MACRAHWPSIRRSRPLALRAQRRHLGDCRSVPTVISASPGNNIRRLSAQDEAVFRRLEDGRLNLTRYRALRDAEGIYRGIVETHQDISELRLLEGEKLDLDW